MSDQLDLLDLLPTPEGVRHVCLPDFSLACGEGILTKPKGDKVAIAAPKRWADITCDWCRALGREYRRQVVAAMQGRPA